MNKFYVVNKKNGFVVKNSTDEDKMRTFAAKCNKNNETDSFIVCVYKEGVMEEI